MTIIAAFSNFTSIPLVMRCYQRNWQFVGLMCFCSAFTSFMYHFCEIYNCEIFLSFSAWHRLDNVFAVTSMSLYMLYLTGNITNDNLVYSTLLVAILAQEKDPWNLKYTVIPIVMYAVIGIIANIHWKLGVPEFRYDKLLKGSGLLFIGGIFFVKGLDEHTDYLRFHHGVWHFFLGIASYYNLDSVRMKETKD